MEPRPIGPLGAARPLPGPRKNRRDEDEQRPFTLPRPEAEPAEGDVVLEPRPSQRDLGQAAVARERAPDEAGQHIDLRG